MRPITPQTGYTEADLTSLLEGKNLVFTDCYTIVPKYGNTIRMTTAGRSVKDVIPTGGGSPVTYLVFPNLKVGGLRLKIGIGTQVDEQELVFDYDQTAEAFQLPFARAVRLGRFDGALVKRERFFSENWGTPWVGCVPLFYGRISTADKFNRTQTIFKVKSELILLNVQTPADLYQPGCVHTLYDPGCTLDKDDFKTTGTVESGSTSQVINWAAADANLTLGMIYITTPEGTTLVRTIRKCDAGQLFLAYPLEWLPTVGTTFDAFEGCNRMRSRCIEFSNEENFKGFPFVPVAETAI